MGTTSLVHDPNNVLVPEDVELCVVELKLSTSILGQQDGVANLDGLQAHIT
jgi:hypothetical protein